MEKALFVNSHYVSVDAQFRTLTMLRAVMEEGENFAETLKTKMIARWDRVRNIFDSQPQPPRFQIDTAGSHFYYLWIKCNNVSNCFEYFKGYGLDGSASSRFGAGDEYVRFVMTLYDSHVDMFLDRLKLAIDGNM